MSDFWIIVPVKDTRQSKQRLTRVLSAERRQALAHAMLEDVLEEIAPLFELAPAVLVTVDPFAERLAARFGMRTVTDGALDGHTGAVDGARRRMVSEGATGFLTIPADIPLVKTEEIADIIHTHDHVRGFTIAPAEDEMGSNAIACSPSLAVPLRFGENSYFPHLEAARAAGIEPVVRRHIGIATDVDEPADIARLLARDPESTCRATTLLRELGFSHDTLSMERC